MAPFLSLIIQGRLLAFLSVSSQVLATSVVLYACARVMLCQIFATETATITLVHYIIMVGVVPVVKFIRSSSNITSEWKEHEAVKAGQA